MIELIALIILVGSFAGMIFIFYRKLPDLLALAQETEAKKAEDGLVFKLKSKFENVRPFKSFSSERTLQKILSKVRILSLKIENKAGNHLQRMREKSQKEKKLENDNYWDELKKHTKK